jgi:hypothetical protein
MGACTFTTFGEGEDLQKVFTQLKKEAQYEHGRGGYTGTIAEKPGAELRQPLKIFTREEALDFARKDSDSNDKYGNAYAIAVQDANFVGFLFYGWAAE